VGANSTVFKSVGAMALMPILPLVIKVQVEGKLDHMASCRRGPIVIMQQSTPELME